MMKLLLTALLPTFCYFLSANPAVCDGGALQEYLKPQCAGKCWHEAFGNEMENLCSLSMMIGTYIDMAKVNCSNCYAYTHCIAGFNAVYMCGRAIEKHRGEVKTAMNCNEKCRTKPYSAVMKRATVDGRMGGNCALKYLWKLGCNFDPVRRSCSAQRK